MAISLNIVRKLSLIKHTFKIREKNVSVMLLVLKKKRISLYVNIVKPKKRSNKITGNLESN